MASEKKEPGAQPLSASNSALALESLPIAPVNKDALGSRTLYDIWVHRFGSHLEQKDGDHPLTTLPSATGSATSTGTLACSEDLEFNESSHLTSYYLLPFLLKPAISPLTHTKI